MSLPATDVEITGAISNIDEAVDVSGWMEPLKAALSIARSLIRRKESRASWGEKPAIRAI